jgi:hypothetical protein
MTDADTAATNGNAGTFDIDAITELIVPFEFPFEGSILKGHWYKYKTTTPEWASERSKRFQTRLERFLDIKQQLQATKDTALILKLSKEKAELEDEAARAQYDWLADAIVDWNAVGKGGPVPIESMRLKSFPTPFMVALGQHLEKDRSGENPTLSDSQSGS